jgi:hypothetical protein
MQLAAGACSAQRHPHAGRTLLPLAPPHKRATCSLPVRHLHQQHLRAPDHVRHEVCVSRHVSTGALAEAATAAPAVAAAATAAAATTQPSAMQVVAVLLGWACFAGSCFRSVPQIIKVGHERELKSHCLLSLLPAPAPPDLE